MTMLEQGEARDMNSGAVAVATIEVTKMRL
jgi:hypothetical protein